jgi:hypothetical protein
MHYVMMHAGITHIVTAGRGITVPTYVSDGSTDVC